MIIEDFICYSKIYKIRCALISIIDIIISKFKNFEIK